MVQVRRLKAKDLMRREVSTLSADDTIERALELFEEANIGGAPVVDSLGRLIGVLSLSDVSRTEHAEGGRVGSARRFFEFADIPCEERTDEVDPEEVFYLKEDYSPDVLGQELVGEWMTREVISVGPDSTLQRVCRLMVDHRIHRVFVTTADRLVGVLSSFDIVRAVAGPRKTGNAV